MAPEQVPDPGMAPGKNHSGAEVRKHPDLTTKLALERTGLANERTLMAWVRTCFSMIGFGFSLFSFILTLRKSGAQTGDSLDDALSACLILTIGGTVFMVLAVVQFFISMRELFREGLDRISYLTIFAGIMVCGAGVLCSLLILARM